MVMVYGKFHRRTYDDGTVRVMQKKMNEWILNCQNDNQTILTKTVNINSFRANYLQYFFSRQKQQFLYWRRKIIQRYI